MVTMSKEENKRKCPSFCFPLFIYIYIFINRPIPIPW